MVSSKCSWKSVKAKDLTHIGGKGYEEKNSITEMVGFSNSFKDIVHHAAGHPVELCINTIYTVCLVSQARTTNPEPLHELNQALKRSDSVETSERFTNWILMPDAKR